LQAETRQADIRQSFDDGTQPLLAAEDHENQLAGGGVQFDLEFVLSSLSLVVKLTRE